MINFYILYMYIFFPKKDHELIRFYRMKDQTHQAIEATVSLLAANVSFLDADQRKKPSLTACYSEKNFHKPCQVLTNFFFTLSSDFFRKIIIKKK